jgi:hypothetical protein
MSYYNSSLIIYNNTDNDYNETNKDEKLIAFFKFSITFNKIQLFLDGIFIKQILKSTRVQKFILDECAKYLDLNKDSINNKIKKQLTYELEPIVELKILGKFLYIKVYCGRNNTIENCLDSISNKLRNKKNKSEILKG